MEGGGGVIPVNHCGQPIDILAFTEIPTVRSRQANGEEKSEKVGAYVVGRKIISDVPLAAFCRAAGLCLFRWIEKGQSERSVGQR